MYVSLDSTDYENSFLTTGLGSRMGIHVTTDAHSGAHTAVHPSRSMVLIASNHSPLALPWPTLLHRLVDSADRARDPCSREARAALTMTKGMTIIEAVMQVAPLL